EQASDRRAFLRRAGLAGFGLVAGGVVLGGAKPRRLIVREKSPVNLEFPFESLDSFLTPNALFYVRNHYPQPRIDLKTWRPGVVEVILEGADRGDPKKEMQPPGLVSFARSLPLAKARKPEVLLAYQMNGKDLPPEHGHPARAVVGGWYGMASVKWLRRIIV